jgi:hypothetical protein
MPNRTPINLMGRKFGRLLVIGVSDRRYHWQCVCECLRVKCVATGNLTSGSILSCGCLRRENALKISNRKHGHTWEGGQSHTYRSWSHMLNRCNKVSDDQYWRYGGRGITVCKRWHKFENFLEDMGERPPKMSINRINNDGNYEPDNCEWGTQTDQSNNTRNNRCIMLFGERLTLSELAVFCSKPRYTIQYRLMKAKYPLCKVLSCL